MFLHLQLPLPSYGNQKILPALTDPHSHAHPLQQRGSPNAYPIPTALWLLLRWWVLDLGLHVQCLRREEIVEDAAGARGVRDLVVLEADLLFELAGLHLFLCGFGVFSLDVFGGVDFLFGHWDGDWWGVEGAEAVGDLLN
jgi:hypothetical protein